MQRAMITPSRELDDLSSRRTAERWSCWMGWKGAGDAATTSPNFESAQSSCLPSRSPGAVAAAVAEPAARPCAESRIDVAVAGLPAGVNAAITITDPSGRVVANLTTSGQVFVTGPGAFSVSAGAVMSGTATYVATVVPNPVNVPAPPGITAVDVCLRARPAFEARIRGRRDRARLSYLPGVAPGRVRHLRRRAAGTDTKARERRPAGAGARHFARA